MREQELVGWGRAGQGRWFEWLLCRCHTVATPHPHVLPGVSMLCTSVLTVSYFAGGHLPRSSSEVEHVLFSPQLASIRSTTRLRQLPAGASGLCFLMQVPARVISTADLTGLGSGVSGPSSLPRRPRNVSLKSLLL